MSAAVMTVLVTLASLAIVHAIARGVIDRIPVRRARTPSTRANVVFLQGVAPTAIGVCVALGIVLPAFLLFEPAHNGERAGFVLVAAAALGAVHLIRIAVRTTRMLRLTRRLTQRWRLIASPLNERTWGLSAFAVDTGLPVVAVAGLLRPRLFVDNQILEVCTPGEIAAIAAHERAHVSRRDNLLRLLINACAGPRSRAAVAWRQASEHAADSRAADSPNRALDLASALIKIARLAPAWSLDGAVLSTIHDGATLEARVQHLLSIEPFTSRRQTPILSWFAFLPLALALCIGSDGVLSSAYHVIETVVRHLP